MTYEPMEIPDYINKLVKNKHKKRKRHPLIMLLSDFLIYILMIIFIMILLALRSFNNGNFIKLYGYSAMTVIGNSMQQHIPPNSLIIIKKVDPQTIKIGDDISFHVTKDIIVTHRTVAIIENYNSSGKRGFQTQGLNNTFTDSAIVPSDDVLGKVVFHNLAIGKILVFIKANFFYVFVSGVLLLSCLQLVSTFHSKKRKAKLTISAL